jgi:hypothetical protein
MLSLASVCGCCWSVVELTESNVRRSNASTTLATQELNDEAANVDDTSILGQMADRRVFSLTRFQGLATRSIMSPTPQQVSASPELLEYPQSPRM